MFIEFKDHKGIDVPTLSKILVANRGDNSPIAVFETPDLQTSVAVVEFDLILAFKFLVDALADQGVAMDSYLARLLNDLDPSFKTSVMKQFVKFRRANGIELDEGADFLKTKDIGIYEIEESVP
ncbi:MAG: hypothetical protein K2Q26_03605 [Bdellovibrionales bacterium]|nr:hypothetical protein [Bdellovibrionales bacterium]